MLVLLYNDVTITSTALGCVDLLHQVKRAACLEPLNLLRVEGVVDLDFERGTAVARFNLERKRRPLRESAQPLDGNPATQAGENT